MFDAPHYPYTLPSLYFNCNHCKFYFSENGRFLQELLTNRSAWDQPVRVGGTGPWLTVSVNSRRQNDFDSGPSVRHLIVESRTLLHSTAGFPIFQKKSINIEKS